MRLRSGRTKVEREKTADDLMVERIKAQYLVKRPEKEKLKNLIAHTRWWVDFVIFSIWGISLGCYIYSLLKTL